MRKSLVLGLLLLAITAGAQQTQQPVALGVVGTTPMCDSFSENVSVERFDNAVYLTIKGEQLSPRTHIVLVTPQWMEADVVLRAGITPTGKVAISGRIPGNQAPDCLAFAFVVYRIER